MCTLRKILRARLDAYIQNKKILDCQGAQLNKRTASRCFCINNLQGIKSNKALEYWTYQNFLWSKQKHMGIWFVACFVLAFNFQGSDNLFAVYEDDFVFWLVCVH